MIVRWLVTCFRCKLPYRVENFERMPPGKKMEIERWLNENLRGRHRIRYETTGYYGGPETDGTIYFVTESDRLLFHMRFGCGSFAPAAAPRAGGLRIRL